MSRYALHFRRNFIRYCTLAGDDRPTNSRTRIQKITGTGEVRWWSFLPTTSHIFDVTIIIPPLHAPVSSLPLTYAGPVDHLREFLFRPGGVVVVEKAGAYQEEKGLPTLSVGEFLSRLKTCRALPFPDGFLTSSLSSPRTRIMYAKFNPPRGFRQREGIELPIDYVTSNLEVK